MLSAPLKRKTLRTKSQPTAEAKVSTMVFKEVLMFLKPNSNCSILSFQQTQHDRRATRLIWSLLTIAATCNCLRMCVLITVFSRDTHPNSEFWCSMNAFCTLFFIAVLWEINHHLLSLTRTSCPGLTSHLVWQVSCSVNQLQFSIIWCRNRGKVSLITASISK